MNMHDVLDFLLPNLSDPIQVAFMVILLTMIFSTVISAHKYAGPTSWEQKWNRGTPNDDSDDLDIEHGSVTDLWHAVATGPEKLAEVMPGLLLVVGLLGTFLGLGLALNHASNILGQPNAMSASGAANSMQDLLGLLQGLGTKFKTSTWGISGFVLLKIWSEITRFEEKRLTWVISKVKTELDKRGKITEEFERNKQQQLFTQMSVMTEKMTASFTEHVGSILAQNERNHETSSKALSANFSEHFSSMLKQNEQNHKDALTELRSCFTELAKESSSSVIVDAMQMQTKILHKDINELHSVMLTTNTAMTDFTESTRAIVGNMSDAATQMANGADKVGGAASELVNAIDAFKLQFTDVLDNVRKDLGSAIQNMSQQASTTLEKGSQQLGDATLEISIALAQLSDDVKATMNEVKGSIAEALKIQKDAAIEFTTSSRTLGEGITKITEEVGKLGKPITAGLTAISTSNREMSSTIKKMDQAFAKLDVIIEQLQNIPQSLKSLDALEKTSTMLQHLMGELRSMCDALEPIKHLRSDTKEFSAQLHSDSNEISNHLNELARTPVLHSMVQELQGLRKDVNEALSIYEKEAVTG